MQTVKIEIREIIFWTENAEIRTRENNIVRGITLYLQVDVPHAAKRAGDGKQVKLPC